MSELNNVIQGLVYGWSWNLSIFGGYLLFVPLSYLQIIVPKFYRKTVDLVVTYWQYYITTLLVRLKCRILVTGDPINSDEVSIVISNHRTRVDWNFLWPAMYHAVQGKNKWLHSTKFVLKNSIRYIPAAGWVMQMTMYLFINRNWQKDKAIIDDYVEYVHDNDYKHILILFPEGTDFTPKTKESSDRYAAANGLPKYKHVLHPRSTGFVYLVDEMRKKKCIDAVYDLTLIYPDGCAQNEEELFLRGKFPPRVCAHLVRYPIEVLPETKEGLKEFLEKRWSEKEKTIELFGNIGYFLHPAKVLQRDQYLSYPWIYFTHFLWLIITFSFIALLASSDTYAWLVKCHILLLYITPLITKKSMFKIRKNLLGLVNRGTSKNK